VVAFNIVVPNYKNASVHTARRTRLFTNTWDDLVNYLYNLKNTLDDDEKANNFSAGDKKELQDIINETLDWMEENPKADKDDYATKQKEVENIANPIMRNFYAGGAGGEGGDDMGDFGIDEL